MKEYIHHEINGLLFEHRSYKNLAKQMERFINNPDFAAKLAKRKYLQSDDGSIPNMTDHARQIEELYHHLVENAHLGGAIAPAVERSKVPLYYNTSTL